ncbi:MAG: 2,3-diaminopropionate biosynthesis protein SbnA [Myxococcota bacterium]|nr:2,3-diaminopropionate biosynthesis protein SbnA [Myxococcota bacterium]
MSPPQSGSALAERRPPDPELLRRVLALAPLLRPTPVVPLRTQGLELYAKLEFHNPFGSIKDRTAYWILKGAVERGELRSGATVVESSSGNFAFALAGFAKLLGLRFVPVIDPNITGVTESFLRRTCDRVVKVEERDETGGYLGTRLRKVQELCAEIPGAYWPNQYGNPDGMDAHYQLTGAELCQQLERLDLVFIGVSTGGTIAGVSRRLKERFPAVRIVAVDAVGSVIFGGAPQRRHIPGIGASVVPELVAHARIDEVVMIPERQTAEACQALLWEHGLFVGGSSGSAFAAARQYPVLMKAQKPPVAVFICPDRGTAYLETVYNPGWVARLT